MRLLGTGNEGYAMNLAAVGEDAAVGRRGKALETIRRDDTSYTQWRNKPSWPPGFKEQCGRSDLPTNPCHISGKATKPPLVWHEGRQFDTAFEYAKGCGWLCKCRDLDKDGHPTCKAKDRRGGIAFHADFREVLQGALRVYSMAPVAAAVVVAGVEPLLPLARQYLFPP